MVQTRTDEFTPVWENPGDEALHWSWDKMHNPRPIPPLCFDFGKALLADVFSGRAISVNGYTYSNGFTIPMPPPEVWQRGVLDVWENDYVPRIRETCAKIRGTESDRLSAIELVDSLDSIIKDADSAFSYTMIVAMAFGMPTNLLIDFCEAKLGADGTQLAITLLQGTNNASAGGGAGLGELTAKASRSPEVAAAIRQGRFETLESVAGGRDFLAQLREYLDEFGWRVDQWGHLHIPTWAEDPRTPLKLIGRYLSEPELSPEASIERSVAAREQAQQQIEARLSADDRGEFDRLFEACKHHVRISEGRAFWQLTIDGSLRVPCLALGRKLVEAGVLSEPNDVFFLSLEELKQLARKPTSRHEIVAERKADLERWERLTPPLFLGAPPPDGPEAAVGARFWGGKVAPSEDARIVKGHAASKGTAAGRARIIMQLNDSGLLQTGDVLVCPSTAPPWTPLFAIAAAVVTDTGGILSHSAICAREFGIPAVVGTQTATHQIPDGAMITVDGAAGTVRIE